MQVAMRQEKGSKGEPLSMGFGFVECSSEDVAKAVMKRLQARLLKLHQTTASCIFAPTHLWLHLYPA